MKRKDCDNPRYAGGRPREHPYSRFARRALLGAAVLAWASPAVLAGSVRLWPSAVVVEDSVQLCDLCELGGFDAPTEQALRALVVAPAPPAGGSRIVHLEMIRAMLERSGTNMAKVTVHGSTECAVSRPSRLADAAGADDSLLARPLPHPGADVRGADPRLGAATPRQEVVLPDSAQSSVVTLRQAVVRYFNVELERYGGTAEVAFNDTSKQVLDLSGPPYEFKVRRRGGSPLGLTALEVDVLVDDRIVQTVSLVVQVSMIRGAVVARRAISQGAAIRSADVAVRTISFARLDKMGLDDTALAIGQRAKRFIQEGTLLEPAMLESVPLVQRGELVTLTSVAGGVRIVTTARAAESGHLHEVIRVQSQDRRRVEFDAVVVGLGKVQIGGGPTGMDPSAVARGGHP